MVGPGDLVNQSHLEKGTDLVYFPNKQNGFQKEAMGQKRKQKLRDQDFVLFTFLTKQGFFGYTVFLNIFDPPSFRCPVFFFPLRFRPRHVFRDILHLTKLVGLDTVHRKLVTTCRTGLLSFGCVVLVFALLVFCDDLYDSMSLICQLVPVPWALLRF